jgi:GAF domain-containing protein
VVNNLKNNISIEEQKRLDSLQILLSEYQKLQTEIDIYFESTIRDKVLKESDDNSTGELTARYYAEKILIERIKTEVVPLAARIQAIVEPLSQTQIYELTSDTNSILNNLTKASIRFSLVVSVSIGLAIFIVVSLILSLRKSIKKPIKYLDSLALGELPDDDINEKTELLAVIKSASKVKSNLQKASIFASNIGEGKFDVDFEPASNKDVLGNALLLMRKKLQIVAEEDKKQFWTATGLTKFTEVLRKNQSLTAFADEVLETLIRYVQANQGAIFIAYENDNERYLEMVACYAYDRKKYLNKRIEINETFYEGMLGQVYAEGETLSLTDVPDGYISITSGLGYATPTNILMVPLKMNDIVEGVMELASFHKFDKHHIAFIERICENIASAVRNAKTNERTKKLLELANRTTQELRTQEEEMRQNMEELTATQEEMKRKSEELEQLLSDSERKERSLQEQEKQLRKAYNDLFESKEQIKSQQLIMSGVIDGSSNTVVVVDTKFKLLLSNRNANVLFTNSDLVQIGVEVIELFDEKEQEGIRKNLSDALNGNIISYGLRKTTENKTYYFDITFFPITDNDGDIFGACILGRDITERKIKDEEIRRKNQELENKNMEMQRNQELLKDLSEEVKQLKLKLLQKETEIADLKKAK